MNSDDKHERRLDRALDALRTESIPEVDLDRQMAAIRARLEGEAEVRPRALPERRPWLWVAAASLLIAGWLAWQGGAVPDPMNPRTVGLPPPSNDTAFNDTASNSSTSQVAVIPDPSQPDSSFHPSGAAEPSLEELVNVALGGLSVASPRDDRRVAMESLNVDQGRLLAFFDTAIGGEDEALARAALVGASALDAGRPLELLAAASQREGLAAEAIAALLEQGSSGRWMATRALEDDRFLAALEAWQANPGSEGVRVIASTLDRIDMEREPERATAFVRSLLAIGPDSARYLTRARCLRDEDYAEAIQQGIEATDERQAAEALVLLLDQREFQGAAARALGRIADPSGCVELVDRHARLREEPLALALKSAVASHPSVWSALARELEPARAVQLLEVLVEFSDPASAQARLELAYRDDLPVDARLLSLQSLRDGSDQVLGEALRRVPNLPPEDRRIAASAVVQASQRFGLEVVLDALGTKGPSRRRFAEALADASERSPSGLVRVSRELTAAVHFDSLRSFQP